VRKKEVKEGVVKAKRERERERASEGEGKTDREPEFVAIDVITLVQVGIFVRLNGTHKNESCGTGVSHFTHRA